jgi:starch-binding outer membrane protein, SusD/RagB family
MHATMKLGRAARGTAALAAALAAAACYNFNIADPNGPTLSSLISNPNQANLAAAATGIFQSTRIDQTRLIWYVGSMGREGANLSNNNQPDWQEPFFGPVNASEDGGRLWFDYYTAIRNCNNYIDAVPKATDLVAADKAASIGFAETVKALMFLYIVELHGNLGAPVDVDRPVSAPAAPFVTEDSVYGYIIGLLDSARTNLAAAGTSFPFTVPPGYAAFNTPQSWRTYTWALTGKAQAYRATASASCGAPCDAAALVALDSSFISNDPGSFSVGPEFDFSTGSGDLTNELADPLDGPNFFAIPADDSTGDDSLPATQLQVSGQPDQRELNKIALSGVAPSVAGGIFSGLKFTIYFSSGAANPSAPIPIIRDEELILLRAEAEIGTGALSAAVTDLNLIRENSGGLPPYSGAVTQTALLTELLYNRQWSLLWEQGTRWIDARRFNLLSTIPIYVPGGAVPTFIPIPTDECNARSLPSTISGCTPLGT